jgi:hypothetical protein
MNGYKFRIELSAWFAKTVLAVFSAFVLLQLLMYGDSVRAYPTGMRWVAEHESVIIAGFIAATGFVWFCYWKAFRILRADKRYGKDVR